MDSGRMPLDFLLSHLLELASRANALVLPSIQADITEEVGSCEEEVRYQVGP